jgi:hypothetical protein
LHVAGCDNSDQSGSVKNPDLEFDLYLRINEDVVENVDESL